MHTLLASPFKCDQVASSIPSPMLIRKVIRRLYSCSASCPSRAELRFFTIISKLPVQGTITFPLSLAEFILVPLVIMSAFHHITKGGLPQGGPTAPLQQAVSQGVLPTNAPMGSAFHQRGIDPRPSHQVPQQLAPRPGPPQAGHIPQQRLFSNLSSPQSQDSYPSAQTQERAPRSYGDIIPDEFGRFIEVSDLTAATFTEEKYHQYLSTPITIRFEKIEPSAKYDSAGEKVKSTWLNCTRTRLPSVDAAQSEDEIQRLNRRDNKKGLTLMKKQQSLGPNAQTQLTKAERDLSAAVQDTRFNIILKQLDWTEKSISQRQGKGSKRHSSRKPRKERASITAYFSRCPRTNQVPSMLYRQLEREKFQAQAQSEQQRQVLSALKDREQRDKREREETAEHKIRQEETIANRMQEQQMIPQQQQQRSMGQQMHPNTQAPYFQSPASGPQHQPGPTLHGHIQSCPPQQTGLQPQMYAQGRSIMDQQLGSVPQQQHPHFQLNNGRGQVHPQPPPNGLGMLPQAFGQNPLHQGPPQNFRQMPPHPQQGIPVRGPNGEFVHQPINGNRPIISVVTEHEKHSNHRRNNSWHSSSSSPSGSDSHSMFDSDSEHSSTSTKQSSLGSASSDSPRITRAISNKPRRVHGSAGSHYTLAPVDDGLVREKRRRPIKRRHEKAYIQTGSDRKIEVPRLSSPRGPVIDPLTQVREAYLAGHADHERLVSGIIKSDALATRNQSSSRSSRSEIFSEAERLDTLPRKYRTGLLSRSDIQNGPQPRILQYPQIRRVSPSEVGRELNRERAQDFKAEFSPRMGISVQATGRRDGYSKDHNSQYDTRVLEDEFVAHMRVSDARPTFLSSRCNDMEPHTLRERQRQRQEDLFMRSDREGFLRGIGVDDRGRRPQSPERHPFIDVPSRNSEGHFEDRAGFIQRSWL